MKKKTQLWIIGLLLCAAAIAFFLQDRHGHIDEWSAALTESRIEIAEAASGYGVEKRSCEIPAEEYRGLVALLRTVTEANSSRRPPKDAKRIDYRLALHYKGKLWLFHCYENDLLGLMFHDRETGAYFGCEGKLLYIKSPALWDYIVNTVDEKAK